MKHYGRSIKMNHYHTSHRYARIRRVSLVCLILAVIIFLVPAMTVRSSGAQDGNSVQAQWPESKLLQVLRWWGLDDLAPMDSNSPSAISEIRYPISDIKIGLWFEGVPEVDIDNLRYNEIDDPAPTNDGDATYVVTTKIKAYRSSIAPLTLPPDAINISVSLIWTIRYEEEDSFHVSWSQIGVIDTYYFGPVHNPGTTYTTYTDTWTTNPATGLPWTPETVNTVSGLGFDSNVESEVHVTQAYLQIDYDIGDLPSIDVEKYVWDGSEWVDADEITGPYLLSGTAPEFKFEVTNTGNVDLSNVDLTDDVYGDISLDGTLAAGISAEYYLTGTWAEGQHTNTATASGDYDGSTYADSDDANYFGGAQVLDVEKYVLRGMDWVDADEPTGPYLLLGTVPQFRFVVTNISGVDLSDVDLTDNLLGDISLDGTLLAGTSAEYIEPGTWAEGQHTNTATATGDYDGNTFADSDDANYFGAIPGIEVEKYILDGTVWVDADEISGPYLLPDTNPRFKFEVTNTGNVDLSNVDLTDNVYGNISLDGTLDAGTSVEYLLTGTWSEGQHTNTATATGDHDGNTYTDSDDANYFGANPSIDVEKYILDGVVWVDADEITGPYLLPGFDPQFKFVIANTGNVDLNNVDLTDNVYGDISLDGTLDAGTSVEYLLTGTWAEGQHTNTAIASGDYDGNTYTDSDDANYFGGVTPEIDVEKYVLHGTEWVDADEPAGPYLLPGMDPQFKFVVTNTGNVDLSNVDLTDNVYGDISLDGALTTGTSAEYFFTGTWAEGQHTNTASVSGSYGGNTFTDSDEANYFGATLALRLVKTANPTTYDSVGDVIVYNYQLINDSDIPLDAPFTVTDDKVSVTCSEAPISLAPGDSILCTANYIISVFDMEAGSVTNTAQGHGYYGGIPIDSNYDNETVMAIILTRQVYLPVVFGGNPSSSSRLESGFWNLK